MMVAGSQARTWSDLARGELAALTGVIVISAVTGTLMIFGWHELAALALGVAFAMSVIKPQFGAYLFLLANPLIVGIGRGELVPFMRPNEALLLMIILAMGLHILFEIFSGKKIKIKLISVDIFFIGLLVTGSVFPLIWCIIFNREIEADDILYSMVLWKYFMLYAYFRKSLVETSQVMACLWLSMFASSIVAIVAILQVNNLFQVPDLLMKYYDNPFEGHTGIMVERATSTLATSFGVADTMIMNLLIACALLTVYRKPSMILSAVAILFLSACIAAGSFSGVIGLLVAVVAFGFIVGCLRYIIAIGLPLAVLVGATSWQVIAQRLEGFRRPSGLPHSWEGRWENLERFFLPELAANFGWLLGVRPAPRLVAPEPWREWVYIESGYIWLLWIGGLPFLFAFLFFVWASFRQMSQTLRTGDPSPQMVAAIACMSYLLALTILMLFDPHFTVRGSADLFFPLLALALFRPRFVYGPRVTAVIGGRP